VLLQTSDGKKKVQINVMWFMLQHSINFILIDLVVMSPMGYVNN